MSQSTRLPIFAWLRVRDPFSQRRWETCAGEEVESNSRRRASVDRASAPLLSCPDTEAERASDALLSCPDTEAVIADTVGDDGVRACHVCLVLRLIMFIAPCQGRNSAGVELLRVRVNCLYSMVLVETFPMVSRQHQERV